MFWFGILIGGLITFIVMTVISVAKDDEYNG